MNAISQIALFFILFLFFGSMITAGTGELAVENKINPAEIGINQSQSLKMRKWGIIGIAIAITLGIALMFANGIISIS